ncbi:MAG: type I-B CRISPR-associated endonuclease Cas1b [Nitrososphaeria archaeon]|nr:type I-B CRISPR-associated endonuclease Cas1b [Candidatus Jingweiarchaeum tengchongense]
MKVNYYIIRNGKLMRKENTVYFVYARDESQIQPFSAEVDGEEVDIEFDNESEKPEYEKRILPIEQINSIFGIGRVSITSGVVSFLAKHGIPMHFFDYYGHYESTLYPYESLLSGEMHIRQAAYYLDRFKRLKLSKKFVEGTAKNMLKNLEYYQNEGKNLNEEIITIKNHIANLDKYNDVNELMAIEETIRDVYYGTISKILKKAFQLEGRTKYPPENQINAMISFGNSLLYGVTINAIYHTQLDQTISFFHKPSERRFSLSLDISEIFKPLIVDRTIFKLINKDVITENDFVKELNGYLLNKSGKEKFVREFDEQIKTTIKHRDLGRNVSYEHLIYLECLKLCKEFLDLKPYEPFVIWW